MHLSPAHGALRPGVVVDAMAAGIAGTSVAAGGTRGSNGGQAFRATTERRTLPRGWERDAALGSWRTHLFGAGWVGVRGATEATGAAALTHAVAGLLTADTVCAGQAAVAARIGIAHSSRASHRGHALALGITQLPSSTRCAATPNIRRSRVADAHLARALHGLGARLTELPQGAARARRCVATIAAIEVRAHVATRVCSQSGAAMAFRTTLFTRAVTGGVATERDVAHLGTVAPGAIGIRRAAFAELVLAGHSRLARALRVPDRRNTAAERAGRTAGRALAQASLRAADPILTETRLALLGRPALLPERSSYDRIHGRAARAGHVGKPVAARIRVSIVDRAAPEPAAVHQPRGQATDPARARRKCHSVKALHRQPLLQTATIPAYRRDTPRWQSRTLFSRGPGGDHGAQVARRRAGAPAAAEAPRRQLLVGSPPPGSEPPRMSPLRERTGSE